MSFGKGYVQSAETRGEPGAAAIVLLLHGLDSGPATLKALADAIEGALPQPFVIIPKLPLAWYRCVNLRALTDELLSALETILREHSYEQVFLIGHSAGGVLAQAVYLQSQKDLAHPVAPLVARARLVLLAPLNRGWALSHHLPLLKKLAWLLGLVLMPLVKLGEKLRSILTLTRPDEPWILQVRKSAPFLVWLRMAWLELQQRPAMPGPDVVQLLGSVDELVSWRDMVDPAVGASFVYLQVPATDHVAVIDLEDPVHGEARRAVFVKALGDIAQARVCEWSVEPWDTDPLPPDPKVRRVVFVIHGIRDEGHWTQKIAAWAKREYVERTGRPVSEIEVVTSSYGYFSMLQFLMVRERREKVSWLVEHYVEARRRFPNARFSFVGHSNGTYLVAHAMERFPEIRFERLALAGSVLSSKFDWKRLGAQVTHVLNYAATGDWVVGIFPRIADLLPLRWLLGPSLGGAGIVGFTTPGPVQTLQYRKGQHGAAIEEENWPFLARFAVDEPPVFTFPVSPPADFDKEYRERRFALFERFWGPITCLVGWTLVLAVFLVRLPMLAWSHPIYFWVAPLPLLVGLVVATTLAEVWSTGVALRERKRRRNLLAGLLVVVVVVAYVAVLAMPTVAGALLVWNSSSGEALRMASLLAYFWGIHRVLTRV